MDDTMTDADDFEIVMYEETTGYTALIAHCGEFLGSCVDLDPLMAQYKALCALEVYLTDQRKALKNTLKQVKAAQVLTAEKYDGEQTVIGRP